MERVDEDFHTDLGRKEAILKFSGPITKASGVDVLLKAFPIVFKIYLCRMLDTKGT